MKFALSSVFLVAMVIVLAQAKPSPEMMEKITKAMEVCKPKAGATDDDINALMKHEIPTTKTGTCFVACMDKELGIMTADNKIDVDHIKKVSAHLRDKDADKYDKGMKVVETCAAEANAESDECEVAKKMMECSKKEAAAAGLSLKDMMEE